MNFFTNLWLTAKRHPVATVIIVITVLLLAFILAVPAVLLFAALVVTIITTIVASLAGRKATKNLANPDQILVTNKEYYATMSGWDDITDENRRAIATLYICAALSRADPEFAKREYEGVTKEIYRKAQTICMNMVGSENIELDNDFGWVIGILSDESTMPKFNERIGFLMEQLKIDGREKIDVRMSTGGVYTSPTDNMIAHVRRDEDVGIVCYLKIRGTKKWQRCYAGATNRRDEIRDGPNDAQGSILVVLDNRVEKKSN